MKNKHNTMNSSSSLRTYERMKKKIEEDKRAVCALVEVIAKKSGNEPWEVLIDGKLSSNERIRKISIDKFYELVSGKKHSFKNLCEKLPIILEDVLNSMDNRDKTNTVLAELKMISPNLLKSIYRSSFKKYEGFDKFNI